MHKKTLQNLFCYRKREEVLAEIQSSWKLNDLFISWNEEQKIGYRFPGERAACYSADLLLRQYKRVKDRDSKNFNYKNIRPVHVIVFFEHSPKEFHAFPDTYLHSFHAVSDTSLEMNLLQNFLFVPLDIFHKTMENKDINTELEAWLTFLSTDDPEQIYNLIRKFPMFKEMYEDIFQLCQNTERVMNMYSKELAQLDHNTAEYMVDEMQKDLDEARSIIREKDDELKLKSDELEKAYALIEELQKNQQSNK